MRGFEIACCIALSAATAACGAGGLRDEGAPVGDDGGDEAGDSGHDARMSDSSLVDVATLLGDGALLDAGSRGDLDAAACPPAATTIYVTGQPAELWTFWPPTFTFSKVGTLSCTSSPTHMTVDRNANAWVVAGGNIYKTSTRTAACAPLSTWTQQANFEDFALSMVGVTSTDTTLYLLGASSLASFDIASGAFKVIGSPVVSAFAGDMTSNGDGSLYFLQGFVSPHPLYRIDPATAMVAQTYQVNAPGTGSQALAYFGGRFYAFESNVVYEYDPATNAVTMLGTAPLTVTGAGQSTCVPQTPQDGGPPMINQ
jgi:hypothetical protein